MLKFIRKQLLRFWKPKNQPNPPAKEEAQHCDPEGIAVPQVWVCEHQQVSEPHLMPPPVKPEHPAAIKQECRVEDSLGRNVESQEPGAEPVHDLWQQLSNMAARGEEVLCRLREAEEALDRQRQKQSCVRSLLIRLEHENARLVAKVNTQERLQQEKFHHLMSLNNVLLSEEEQEIQALKRRIRNLETLQKTQKTFKKRTPVFRKIPRRYTNNLHKHE